MLDDELSGFIADLCKEHGGTFIRFNNGESDVHVWSGIDTRAPSEADDADD